MTHFSHQAIADLGNGFDDVVTFRIVFEGFSKLGDGIAESLVDYDLSRPDLALELFAGYRFAGPAREIDEQFHGPGLESGGLAVLADLV